MAGENKRTLFIPYSFPKRCLTPLILLLRPSIAGRIFGLVDILFIFGKEKRCNHDIIAGTKVVNVWDRYYQAYERRMK